MDTFKNHLPSQNDKIFLFCSIVGEPHVHAFNVSRQDGVEDYRTAIEKYFAGICPSQAIQVIE